MECDKYKELLQAYHDNELEKGRETFLFTHLSECEDCRSYFKTINLISSNIQKEEFPLKLEERILNSIKENAGKRENRFFKRIVVPAVAYSAAVIFIVLSLFLYNGLKDSQNELNSLNRQVRSQARTIELLFNCLPPTVVESSYNNEVIIKANM
jgi:predicted anti-sigma-YlaC factor YlaD